MPSIFRIGIACSAGVTATAGMAAWILSGQPDEPIIDLVRPNGFIGRNAVFEATVDFESQSLTSLDAIVEQNDSSYSLFSLDEPPNAAEIQQESETRIRVSRYFDRDSHPSLRSGPARVIVRASHPSMFGIREINVEATFDVEVLLDPPRLSPLSKFHYINHGGSESVVYRTSANSAESGVFVGDRFFPGYQFPAVDGNPVDDLRFALFALSYDQELDTPITLYARDRAGNETRSTFDYRVFPSEFHRSNLAIGEDFLRRVVPAIAARAPELADENVNTTTDVTELLDLYLFINGELRRQNNSTISAIAGNTAEHRLWEEPFRQLENSQVESRFADHRVYSHQGREIDQQVHLGFDLASTTNAAIHASNTGRIVFANYLGIYGNCIIIDHGMGLQSLYAHLSSIDVSVGEEVKRNDPIGLSGQTGLAGGDHLHFSLLLHGQPVTPVEWWDEHWIEDRIHRKLREASTQTSG